MKYLKIFASWLAYFTGTIDKESKWKIEHCSDTIWTGIESVMAASGVPRSCRVSAATPSRWEASQRNQQQERRQSNPVSRLLTQINIGIFGRLLQSFSSPTGRPRYQRYVDDYFWQGVSAFE